MASDSYDPERIAWLAGEILRHKSLYYAGQPEISDADFDRLEDELRQLSPDHPALEEVGQAPVGDDTIPHREPMLSLQKVYEVKDLLSWMDDQPVIGTWKVDGNSMSLVYEGGRFLLGKTRGNGRVGENVTEKVRWISDIIPDLGADLDAEIRGEIYCSDDAFARLADEMAARRLEKPTNPRNIVAGVLGRKAHVDLARFFNFLAFDLIIYRGDLQFQNELEKLNWLEKKGFALPDPRRLKSQAAVQNYLKVVHQQMADSTIGLDGAVFTLDDLGRHRELGATAHHPRYKMSFKWQGESAEAVIRTISWATSRLGVVTPVAVIEPVTLSGAKITNVTLHNALHVRTYNLKPGDRIEIVRSGEVIPKFLEVKKAGPGKHPWPEECPSCGAALDYDDVRLRCPNREGCPAQQKGAILNWIRCVEIDDLSEKRLEHLMDAGMVRGPADLYRLEEADFLRLPLTKEKMARKLYGNIQGSLHLPLARFLNGLGIEGAGLTSWEKLLESWPTLDAIRAVSGEELAAVDGFAGITAGRIVDGLQEKAALIDELLAVGVAPQMARDAGPSSSAGLRLAGRQVAITGKLSRPRKELEGLIKAAGGKPASAVSKNTFALVSNDPDSGSSKMKKARELGIPVWSEEELESQLSGS